MPAEVTSEAKPTRLLTPSRIFLQPESEMFPEAERILARFPDAERISVPNHHRIPELHLNEELEESWNTVKRTTIVLGVKRRFEFRPNGRSSDYIGPGLANGCAMSCAYCYVARRKGSANPITFYVNIEEALAATERFAAKLPPKEPNQVDPRFWTFDIGENSDVGFDATVNSGPRQLVELFRRLPNAKATFATKFVNRDLLTWDPQGKTRVRFSLMPPRMAKLLDVRTSPIAERIAAIDDFVRAGYEVHLNFSPVVIYDEAGEEYRELFQMVDAALSPAAKAQVKAEVIFLTHNAALHETNLKWHPRAEDVLWRPEIQEPKRSETGGGNLRYKRGFKGRSVRSFLALLGREMPYCEVRYAF